MKQKMIVMVLVVTLAMTGCVRLEETVSYKNSEKIMVDRKSYVTTEVYDETVKEGGTYTLGGEDFQPEGMEVIDGTEYYFQTETETLNQKEFEEEYYSAVITNESFYGDLTNSAFNTAEYTVDEMDQVASSIVQEYLDGYTLTVKFDHEVTKTNGKANGKSVTFEYTPQQTDYSAWYAYTDEATHTLAGDRKLVNKKCKKQNNKDTTKPTIKFVKSRKGDGKVSALVKDDRKLKEVSINGKKYTSLKKRKITSGSYKGYYRFSLTRKGKNTVEAIDVAGNKRKKSLVVE